eukprot:2745913-Prymnesium_polylepis.1
MISAEVASAITQRLVWWIHPAIGLSGAALLPRTGGTGLNHVHCKVVVARRVHHGRVELRHV